MLTLVNFPPHYEMAKSGPPFGTDTPYPHHRKRMDRTTGRTTSHIDPQLPNTRPDLGFRPLHIVSPSLITSSDHVKPL